MKIRILGNSIRLRLSQTEVQQFLEEGSVEECTRFGADEKSTLTYRLQKKIDHQIAAHFDGHQISIFVPVAIGEEWAQTNQISIDTSIAIDDTEHLRILIEKDFKCLAERIGEDESDLFPHPNIDTLKC